jgi:hypothetical protein
VNPCIFWKIDGNMVNLLIEYINDILIIASKEEITRLESKSIEDFWWVTLDIGRLPSYLGMLFKFEKGSVKIDMSS